MKILLLTFLIVLLNACSTTVPISEQAQHQCLGNVELPLEMAGAFDPVEDQALLNAALGMPGKGKLCQGRVYQAKKNTDISIYRIWNSSNPNSRLGKWWSASFPDGKIAKYRYDYEICYQWSPLDKMTHCQLQAGSKVVVGTGQNAVCSEYLTYPVSAVKQIYIAEASTSVSACKDYDGVFQWQAVGQ